MHAHLLGKAVEISRDRHRAVPKYRALVDNFAPQNTSFLQQALEQQLHLDDPWRLTVTKVPKGECKLPQTSADHVSSARVNREAALLTA